MERRAVFFGILEGRIDRSDTFPAALLRALFQQNMHLYLSPTTLVDYAANENINDWSRRRSLGLLRRIF